MVYRLICPNGNYLPLNCHPAMVLAPPSIYSVEVEELSVGGVSFLVPFR